MKLLIFIIFYVCTSCLYVSAETILVDDIVAIVNDQIILNSEVTNIISELNNKNTNIILPLKIDYLKDTVIEKLIVDSLILQEANLMNVTVTKEQIDTLMNNIALKQNISVEDFKKRLILHDKQHHNYYKNYINNIERFIKMKTIENYELKKRINISDEEVHSLCNTLIRENNKFRKINLNYILLPINKKYSTKKIHQIKKIAEIMAHKIQQGYDFEKVFIDYKENKNVFLVNKMFSMSLFDINNKFSKKLKSIKKGEILGPFSTSKGFYILKVDNMNDKKNIVTQFHVKDFLIQSSMILNNTKAQKNIFNIYNNIKKGIYTFDYAVKHYSYNSDNVYKESDLGWLSKELFNMYFDQENINLNGDNISKPIKSNLGWHIFKLCDIRQVDQYYFENQQQAYNILFSQKKILAKKQWIEELKKISYIEIIKS